MLPLAHAGHWATTVLALAPILVGIALVAGQGVRGRLRGIPPARMRPDADADWPDPQGGPLER